MLSGCLSVSAITLSFKKRRPHKLTVFHAWPSGMLLFKGEMNALGNMGSLEEVRSLGVSCEGLQSFFLLSFSLFPVYSECVANQFPSPAVSHAFLSGLWPSGTISQIHWS